MFYNPLQEKIIRIIHVPLYYTGLTKTARVSEKNHASKEYTLNRDYSIDYRLQLNLKVIPGF